MSTAAGRKYLFDLSFDAPAAVEVPVEPEAPPEPTFPRAELEAAREAGYAAGRAAGIDEAARRDAARLATAMERVAEAAGTLLEERHAAAAATEAAAIELMLGLARKILPEATRRCAFDELVALVRGCLEDAFDEPRIVVRVPDALFDAAKDGIVRMASGAGYAGKVVILADPALGPADARVEWADGGAERDMARFWNDIDAAAKRAIETLTQSRGE